MCVCLSLAAATGPAVVLARAPSSSPTLSSALVTTLPRNLLYQRLARLPTEPMRRWPAAHGENQAPALGVARQGEAGAGSAS